MRAWLLKFFQPLKRKPDLPDPNVLLSNTVLSLAISSANTKVIEALETIEENKKRTHGPYLSLYNSSSEI